MRSRKMRMQVSKLRRGTTPRRKETKRIIGIDPGLSATGFCMVDFDSNDIFFATIRSEYAELVERVTMLAEGIDEFLQQQKLADYVIIEHMRVYPQRKQKGDPNQLIDIAVLEGVLLARIPNAKKILVPPKKWKGGVPKKIHHQRLKILVENPLKTVSEHAWDAFGLALWGAENA